MPPIRIYREGVLNDEAFRMFLRNSRFPDILQGDIRAVLAGCRLGERRVQELLERFGADVVLDTWTAFEQQCRDTIRKTLEARIPDGVYASEDAVDGDGMTGRPYRVRMQLVKEGGRITIDTRESDDQARAPSTSACTRACPSSSCLVNPGRADERALAPMSDGNVIKKGDVVCLYTSGGGGWGDPFRRPAERVRQDVLGGFVSGRAAAEDYGVVMHETTGLVDLDRTARRRAEPRPGHVPPQRVLRSARDPLDIS